VRSLLGKTKPSQADLEGGQSIRKEEEMEQERGFFGQLFDFSFTEFITTKIIRVLYGLIIFFSAVIAIVAIVGSFSESAVVGAVVLVVSPLWLLLSVVVGRVILEIVVVMFRIAEHVGDIAKQQLEES